MKFELPPLSLPPLPHFAVTWFINTPILIIIFIVFIVVYLIISSVLFYHWSRYGMRHGGILVARALFTFVSLLFFGFAAIALSYF